MQIKVLHCSFRATTFTEDTETNYSNNTNNYSKNLASFNPTDDLVLNGGVIWDVKGKRLLHKFDKFNNFVSGVFHPSGLEIIINSEIVSFFSFLKNEPMLYCKAVSPDSRK